MRLGVFVRKSSKEAVIEGAKHIKRYYIPQEKLISLNNPLEKNCIRSVQKHADDTKAYRIKQSHINSYMAASALSHLLDGWSYLSAAFDALLRGDPGASVHFAYYAELRSAMSLLASEGIGVFDKKHLGLFGVNNSCEFPKNYYKGVHPNISYKKPTLPTHVFVWDAMEKWTNSAFRPQPEILEIFKVKGRNFKELTEFFHPRATVLSNLEIIKTWLMDWCFDIKAYRIDRENRNFASYRPQRIKNFDQNLDFREIINGLSDFWNILSPLHSNRFNLLDIYLLRKLYRSLYNKIHPSTEFKVLVEDAFHELGLHDGELIRLLCSDSPYENDHKIFIEAAKLETNPLSIIARATLLLRIAVGNTSQIYKSADINLEDLNFIWENCGVDNGFWEPGTMPDNFDELWVDVQPKLVNLGDRVNDETRSHSLSSIIDDNSYDFTYFKQVNRACLWGIAI